MLTAAGPTARCRSARRSPMKRIHIAIPDYGAEAEAEFLDDVAPVTSATLWQALERPMTARAIHGMWVGPEVMIDMPMSHRVFNGAAVPKENQTCFPLPGDLVWFWFPVGAWPGLTEEVYEFGFVYARDARMFIPPGWVPANVFGRVTHNLDGLARACRRFREDGRRDIIVSRIE
jgi:hypothetical protein